MTGLSNPTLDQPFQMLAFPIGANGSMRECTRCLWALGNIVGTNVSISIGAASTEEAAYLLKGVSEGGKTTMPMENTFWGDYFGMCTDKFKINWMVSFNPNMK